MKNYGIPFSFPLSIHGDWVRIQCGTNGQVNYIFGLDGLIEFYDDGAGIYFRDQAGRPMHPLTWWIAWYEDAREERKKIKGLIEDIKKLVNDNPTLLTDFP